MTRLLRWLRRQEIAAVAAPKADAVVVSFTSAPTPAATRPAAAAARPDVVRRGHAFYNRSGYATAELVQWVLAALDAGGIKTKKRIVFTMSPIYSRGCAETTKDTPGAVLSIALAGPRRFSYVRLGNLLRHECAHLRGLDHDDMKDESLLYSEGPLPSWARGLPKLRWTGRAPDPMLFLKG